MRYELSRGSIQKDRHIICYEDEFYSLFGHAVRQRGPWQVFDRGNIEAHRPEYRLAPASDRWLYIEAFTVGFSANATGEPRD